MNKLSETGWILLMIVPSLIFLSPVLSVLLAIVVVCAIIIWILTKTLKKG